MTKKILALALAGTTAFSVFASAMSVSAAVSEYTPVAKSFPADAVTVTGDYKADGDAYTKANFATDLADYDTSYNFYKDLEFYSDGSGDYTALPLYDELKATDVYLYDYGMTADAAEDFVNAVKSFKAAYAAATEFAAVDANFDENGTTDKGGAAQLAALAKADAAVIAAKPAGFLYSIDANTAASRDRQDLTRDFRDFADDLIAPAEFDGTSEEKTDYTTVYNLINGTKKIVYPYSTSANSRLVWLKGMAEELAGDLYLKTETDVETAIENYKAILDARSEEDYASALSYRKFEVAYDQLIEDYDSKTLASKRQEYATKLWALIREKHGDSAGAEKDILKSLLDTADELTDENGYDEGSTEWRAMDAVRTEARAIYRLTAKGSYQSTIDAYVDLLSDAISEVSSSDSTANWQLLRLENAIEAASELVETDYTASSWKKLNTVLATAEKIIDTANASPTLVENTAKDLETAIKTLSVKAVPSTTKKALQDSLKAAKAALAEMDKNASGYQMVALTTAITNADALFKDSKQTNLKDKTLISAVEAATAALEAALTSANQPQGWYTNEAGKWMYGEGDGYYVDGWKKIGNFWFEFDANGVAKQNEWVNEGGKWYYFGNSCVAYTGWGKINGKWYYFGKDCAMVTGWIQLGTTWYYLTPGNGEMVTGWATIGGKSYYFSKEANTLGAMLANTTTPDGYKVGADGAWVK